MRPLSRAYWYALWNFAYISVSTETEPENFLTTIKAFEDKVANEFKINSENKRPHYCTILRNNTFYITPKTETNPKKGSMWNKLTNMPKN